MANGIKEIVLSAQTHAENERVLQALRDTKQDHQDKIAALNVRINELLPIVAASKANLKAAIETF
jgi:acyl-CoA reductase-like NAD-dependent aldehyde dehydrogenase